MHPVSEDVDKLSFLWPSPSLLGNLFSLPSETGREKKKRGIGGMPEN